MKKYLLILVALTLAVAAYGANETADMTRTLSTKPVVAPSPTDYVLGVYSTAAGKQVRRNTVGELLGRNIAFKQLTSALKTNTPTVAGLNTTAADGTRYVNPGNTTACPSDGPPLSICTLPTGVYWYGTVTGVTDWHPVGGASTLSGITDWPSGVSAVEAGFLDGVTSPIQTQIDGFQAGSSGFTATPPTFSNSACTKGQWAVGGGYHYDCVATNTWEAFAYGTNPLTLAPAFASINIAAKTAGPNTPGTGLSAPDSPDYTNSYYYYSSLTAPESGVIANAHWNMYSNGATASSKMEIYSSDGGTLVCATASVTGSASTNQPIDATFSNCSIASGTTYLVGVCRTGDGSSANGPYVQAATSGPATNRVQKPCDGSAFSTAGATEISATRPIYAWGDNSATR